MSVFLGGKWKELKEETATLKTDHAQLLSDFETTSHLLTQSEDNLREEKRKLRYLALKYSELQEQHRLDNDKLNRLETVTVPNLLQQSNEQCRMEQEDLNSLLHLRVLSQEEQNIKEKTELSVVKNKISVELKETQHRLKLYREWKEEADKQIIEQKREIERSREDRVKKNVLIKKLQKDKAQLFSEVTKLRVSVSEAGAGQGTNIPGSQGVTVDAIEGHGGAESNSNNMSLQETNLMLARKVRMLERALEKMDKQKERGSYNVNTNRVNGRNPWQD